MIRRRPRTTRSAVVLLATAAALAGCTSGDPTPPTPDASASAGCLQRAAAEIQARRADGFVPVIATVRAGRVDIDDGITRSSGYLVTPIEALSGDPLPPDPTTVWYPIPETAVPAAGDHVLLLRRATRTRIDGGALYDMSSENVYSVHGRTVVLRCGPSAGTADVAVETLRTLVTG